MAPRPDMAELGTTGLKRTAGVVFDEFLVQLRGVQGARLLREMADNDAMIGAFLFAIEKIITRLDWRFDPFRDDSADGDPDDADVEIAAFFEGVLNDMSESWDATLSQILDMAVYGWSWHEIVYKQRKGPEGKDGRTRSKYSDGKVGWRKFAPRGAETLFKWEFDEDGGIAAMVQVDPYSGHGVVPIPIEKSLLFRTTSRKGNPEGRSLLRNAYRAWFYKHMIEEIEAIGLERDLAGLPVAWVPPEYLSANATPEQQQLLAAVQEIISGIKRNENEGVIFPLMYDDQGNKIFDLQLLSSGGARQFDTDKVITRYDQRISMAVLADFLLLGHEQVGSYSLGVSKVDLFTMSVDSLAKTIADTINDHAVPRLMKLNGMDMSRPPKLTYSEVGHVNIGEIADYVSKLVTAGVIAPNTALEDYLLELAGMPPAAHGVEDTGTGDMSEEDAKAVLALPDKQRLIATRTGVVPDQPAFPGASAPFGGGKAPAGPDGRPTPPAPPQPAPKAAEKDAPKAKE